MNRNMCNSTDMPYEDSRHLLVVVYSIVFIVGIPTNCLTALLTLIQIGKGTITAIYLFGLSLCELMYLSTIPLWIIYVQNDHKWTMGTLSCKVTGYIFFCNIYISILLLCCVSVDRYVAVVYALESRGIRRQRIAAVVTVALFGTVAVIYCPVFFRDDIQDLNSTTCYETPLNSHLVYYNITRFLVGFLIPFALLLFMNYKIFQSIKSSCSLSPSQKAKVKYLAIAIISIFVVCFAPHHFVLLVKSVLFFLYPDEMCRFERDIYTTSVVFLCFSTANSVADPFIYVLVSENAQREIDRIFRACGIELSVSSNEDSSKINNSQRSPKETRETWILGNKEDR
ncbi:probable G-protein coupled receptor 132 isoform X2 [Rhineura floridana]|nr:probable G-protein coupled receptor 132 isoform X2 [Rhineura floridana]XP_061469265.1 probable G-protein coupled receptor 132 isoform X2 [Rhineura floridana]XP_061469266.1 probable G-protein coupled receptor 132 isoform X2 [Rhineura floridana]XP_061469267.1 probable G-protein coupled receptor 132 isoform X2 [Rhineura floridana]XP_061469268.1 probable G-protein coupled receptor 132 isoform X2 [Rhineura floridana]